MIPVKISKVDMKLSCYFLLEYIDMMYSGTRCRSLPESPSSLSLALLRSVISCKAMIDENLRVWNLVPEYDIMK